MDQGKKVAETIFLLYKSRRFRECIDYKNRIIQERTNDKVKFGLDISLVISFCEFHLGRKSSVSNVISYHAPAFERFLANSPDVRHWHFEDRALLLKMLFGFPHDRMNDSNIVIFAAPRSASNFLQQILKKQLGGSAINAESPNQRNPFQIDRHLFTQAIALERVAIKSHAACCDVTMAILNLSGIKPIVVHRNFYDCMESYCSYYSHGSVAQKIGLHTVSDEQKMKYMVSTFAESYLFFHYTWEKYRKEHDNLVFSFDELVNDTEQTVYEILKNHPQDFSREEINFSVQEIRSQMSKNPKSVNFVSHRDRKYFYHYFSEFTNRKKIIELSESYSGFDFGEFLAYKPR